jgi:mannose-1-phosphate guanylyltransferase
MAEAAKELQIKVVIFCGGKGTRMWPISTVGHPKQLDPILGKTSFFRATIERVLKGFLPQDIFLSTGEELIKAIHKQAPEIPKENAILEPMMRDTLGAVGYAAAVVNYRFPESVMIILWGADHIVKKKRKFIRALKKAASLAAENDVIVHVDVKPTYPSVHNGWIKAGKRIKKEDGYEIFEFIKHVEKPNLKLAKQYFESGFYYIHSGYMAVRPRVLLNLYEKYVPQCYAVIKKISQSFGTPQEKKVLAREYPKVEKTSIDFGLFEKLPPGTQLEVPVDIGWIDVGTWELLYVGLPKDKNGNVIMGDVRLIETKDCLVFSREKRIAGVIGLSGLLVVDTENGLLVCPRDQAPKVRQLYKMIYKK